MSDTLPTFQAPRRPGRPTPQVGQSDLFAAPAASRPAAPVVTIAPVAAAPAPVRNALGGVLGRLGGLGGLSSRSRDEDDGFDPGEVEPDIDVADAEPQSAPRASSGGGLLGGLSARAERESAEPDDGPQPGDKPAAPAAPAEPGSTQIRARVLRHIVNKPDFRIYLVSAGGEEFSVVTECPTSVEPGDFMNAHGDWALYKGKKTFRAKIVYPHLPKDAKGLIAWVRTGAARGVGVRTAEKIAEIFGDQSLEAITDPARLIAAGIDPEKAHKLADTWNTSSLQPQLIAYLGGLGLGEGTMSKIIKRYGMTAKQVIDEKPWVLADTIDGVGFPTADGIALRNGHSTTSELRIRAGIRFALKEAVAQHGHCGLPLPELATRARRLLDLPHHIVAPHIMKTLDGEMALFNQDTGLAVPRGVHKAETELVEHFVRLLGEPAFTVYEAEIAVDASQAKLGIKLDPSQRDAAILALTNTVSIITGGPGTGKSTTQKVIVDALKEFKRDIVLGAPTGRAAKRLSEVSNMEASTCHRLLQFQAELGGFTHNAANPFSEDWFILDETSMIDVRLGWAFIQAIKTGAGLTIVGDVDQLPSVGPGQVLRDLIASETIPTARLTTIHRQGKDSGIITAAHRINSGEHPQPDAEEPMRGFAIDERHGPEEILRHVVQLMHVDLPKLGFDPLKDIQVLAAQRKGEIGVAAINLALKAALNPPKDDGQSITIKGRTYSVGDRVMHIRNDYAKGVFNGEVGFVTRAGMRRAEDGEKLEPYFRADYSGVEASYGAKDLDDVEHCFAATVHKSQGCEFPVVILVCPAEHGFMLSRNLLYTGVTRAKGDCILVGDHGTIQAATEKVDTMSRFTGLRKLLQLAEFSPPLEAPALEMGEDPEMEQGGSFLRMDEP